MTHKSPVIVHGGEGWALGNGTPSWGSMGWGASIVGLPIFQEKLETLI